MVKMFLIFLAAIIASGIFVGCRANVPQDSDGQILPDSSQNDTDNKPPVNHEATGESVKILETIWGKYGEDEKFAVYGGSLEQSVNDAPGKLDVTDQEEMTTRYLLPEAQMSAVSEGASLVHMMNNNIFTSVVVTLSDSADMKTLYEAWRDQIQRNQWICGQPDRLLMADVDGKHLLMSFASKEAMTVFEARLKEAYPETKVLYHEAIVS